MSIKLWYKEYIMKTPKRVYIALAFLLFVGGAGSAALLLKPDTKPQEVTVKQVAAVSEPIKQKAAEAPAPVIEPPAQAVAQEPAPEPTPEVQNSFQTGFSAWYAFNRRTEQGLTLPTDQNNERAFCAQIADKTGYVVSSTPSLYAAVCINGGHVAFVEQVNSDGSIWISEMNSRGQTSITDTTPAGGWNRVDFKLLSTEQAAAHTFVK